ncbi:MULTISPECIES: glycosyltransferase family 2 protein [Microbacterium]|uniref:glycosyltransferase family 2 protein n=1 Tax=Microbacterium TaxID=33882 RepID=UPI001469C3CE|nr:MULTISPECIES: glycosyltransferase family 2 protein [Microbacterium]
MTGPRIAICVVTYESAPLIADLVASLPAGAAGTDWVLVVADNASTDGTVAEVRRRAHDAVIVEVGANRGYAAGVNAAVAAAGDRDAYLVLNADVRLAPGCVRALYGALTPAVGVVVPRLIDARGEVIWSMRREPTLLRAWGDALLGAERAGRHPLLGEVVTRPELYEAARDTDWAEGSTQLISAACLSACGPWDESFFLYSEETEFELRARDRGFATRFEPGAGARHLEGGSSTSPGQWSLLVANRVQLYARRHGVLATGLFWFATAAREASRALLGRATSRAAIRDLVSVRRMRTAKSPDWLAGVRV